jgi:hypothetical protein
VQKDEVLEQDCQHIQEELRAALEKKDQMFKVAGPSKPAASKSKTQPASKPASKSVPARKSRGAAVSKGESISLKGKGKERAVEAESERDEGEEDYDAKDGEGDHEMEEDGEWPKKTLTREARMLARQKKDKQS